MFCVGEALRLIEKVSRVKDVVRGGFWLYGSTLINNFMGFIYWMIISAIGGSEVLGITSAVIGFASIISGFLNLGVPIGVQRFLGRSIGMNDREGLIKYFYTTLSFMLFVYLSASTILFLLSYTGWSLGNISPEMLRVASIIVMLGFTSIINSFLLSFLKTNVLFLCALLGNTLKLGIGIALVLYGWGWIGAVLGYVCVSLAFLVIGLYYVLRLIGFRIVFSLNLLLEVIRAGIASWLPSVIVLTGQWLGVLAVFGTSTAVETGYYYVSFTIANVVLMIAVSMLGLLLPVLSGMSDGRKRAAARVLRISLTLMMPIAVLISVYPWLPLSLLGKEYTIASPTLIILLLGVVPLAITSCIYSLVYAYGWYRQVLFIGLIQNVPRIILYYVLTPIYGGLGAAMAYTIGAFTGFVYSLYVAHTMGFHLSLKRIGLIIVIPVIFGAISWSSNLHWLLGTLLIMSSYIVYTKTRILSKRDVKEIASAILSEKTMNRVYEKFKPIIDFIFS